MIFLHTDHTIVRLYQILKMDAALSSLFTTLLLCLFVFLFSLAILFLITVAHLDRITVKPDRTRERTSEKMPELLWTHSMCFWACQLAVWSSWASNVDKIILRLSEFARGFKISKSSLLGIQKIRDGWSLPATERLWLQQAVSLELFQSFMVCVTSHNTV